MRNAMKIKGFLASGFLLGALNVSANEQFTTQDQTQMQPVFNGSFQIVIEVNGQPVSALNKGRGLTTEMFSNTKIISLLRVSPTQEMIARAEGVATSINMGVTAELDHTDGIKSFVNSESVKDLTMNNVPVLDQGKYGTCVTFASTATLDALLEKGDFIDQQCALSHSLFLGNNYWDGAYFASEIIDPLKTHGVVEKNKCSAKYAAPTLKIKTEDYKSLINADVKVSDVKYTYHKNISIDDVRQAIDKNRRVAIGFQLKAGSDPISVQGFDVSVDGKKHKGGLWACKQPGSTKNYCGYAFAGHEVVVTGYDNDQKLLKIRNSWSEKAGDSGEFYMTYEFFDAMGIDGTEIWM